MNTHLRLVADNPALSPGVRLDGRALHLLADVLTEKVQAGHYEGAHVLATLQKLSPFGIAVVATWMAKAGLSETDILNVVV